MARALIIIVILAFLAQLILGCPPANWTLQHFKRLDHMKRYCAVGNPALGEPASRSSWPVAQHPSDPGIRYQPVRYCWSRQSDYDTLNPILQQAIEKWRPAMEVSALAIVPDKGEALICDELVDFAADDALVITDITENTEFRGVRGVTTLGYMDAAIIEGHGDPVRGRHAMYIGRVDTEAGDPPGVLDVRTIAHELGHAIGLDHEQSRNDREDYIWFYCENLSDYSNVQQRLPPGKSMAQACSDTRLAESLGFSAVDWLPDPYDGIHGMMQWSKTTYDYSSIMHYTSYHGSDIGGDGDHPDTLFPDKAVLIGHAPGQGDKNAKTGGFEVFLGGSRDPAQVQLSAGDIARVAQLYPNGQQNGQDVATQTSWSATSWGFRPEAQGAKRTVGPVAA